MRACPFALPVLMLAATPVSAGELIVRIDDGHGRPAVDAVVTARKDGDDEQRDRVPAVRIIDQRDKTFIPFVEIFRPGDEVVFRNSDSTRHHVYSFSPAKTFEFVIAPGESTPPLIRLSKADIVREGVRLGVDFAATVSCYQADAKGRACGACRLRAEGFAAAGVADPTRYL